MKSLFIIILTLTHLSFFAQVISQFNWDNNPVTNAQIGPNAISASSSATSSPNGANGTNGLNAGSPKQNLDFIIADDPIFNVEGIDISFDFQRDESSGTFFKRGSSLVINGCANLSVSYRVDDGAGGYTTISSGNVYSIPNDDTFRTYRFIYLPVSGTGSLLVDGVIVWTNDGVDNRGLYWTGAGNIIIGENMDGTGFDKPFLDNLIIASVTNSALPIALKDFNAETRENSVVLNWVTASELNNDYFSVQRSEDGSNWETIHTVNASGNSTTTQEYQSEDQSPLLGQSYYRLMQTDYDGRTSYSKTASVYFESTAKNIITAYPNPTTDIIYLTSNTAWSGPVMVINNMGQDVTTQIESTVVSNHQITINLSTLPDGFYFIKTPSNEVKKILKG